MIKAKGPGYAEMLEKSAFFEDVFSAEWRDRQGPKQVAASGGRDIEWFFAEPEAAALASDVFDGDEKLKGSRSSSCRLKLHEGVANAAGNHDNQVQRLFHHRIWGPRAQTPAELARDSFG